MVAARYLAPYTAMASQLQISVAVAYEPVAKGTRAVFSLRA